MQANRIETMFSKESLQSLRNFYADNLDNTQDNLCEEALKLSNLCVFPVISTNRRDETSSRYDSIVGEDILQL